MTDTLPFATVDAEPTGPTYTPRWVAEKQAVARRASREATCRDCGADVLVGLDADCAALTATADPRPVTAAGELLALLAGRQTYDRVGADLHLRDSVNHRYSPAGVGRFPVLAAHRCYSPPLPAAPPAPRPAPTTADSRIPF